MIEGSRRVQYRIENQNFLFRQSMSGYISPPDERGRSYLYNSNGAQLLHLRTVQRVKTIMIDDDLFVAQGIGRDSDGNMKTFTVDFEFGRNGDNMEMRYENGFFGNHLQEDERRRDQIKRALDRGLADGKRVLKAAAAGVGGAVTGTVEAIHNMNLNPTIQELNQKFPADGLESIEDLPDDSDHKEASPLSSSVHAEIAPTTPADGLEASNTTVQSHEPIIEGSRPVQYRIENQNFLLQQRIRGFISPPDENGRSFLCNSNGAALLHLRTVQRVQRDHGIQFVAQGIGRTSDGNEEEFTVDFWFGHNGEMEAENGFFGNHLQEDERKHDRRLRALKRGFADGRKVLKVTGKGVRGAVTGAVGGGIWAAALTGAVGGFVPVFTVVVIVGSLTIGSVGGAFMYTRDAIDEMNWDPSIQEIKQELPAIVEA